MKRIAITNALHVEQMRHTDRRTTSVVAEGDDDLMEASDGYHTFTELYDHRITLFIALAKKVNAEDNIDKSMRAFKEGFSFDVSGWKRKVWRSKKHSDGELCFGTGTQFVLGIEKEAGKQITYHIPVERWEETEFAETLETAPEFDGHSSKDVLERLMKL